MDVDKEFNSNQVGSALTVAFGPNSGYVFCYSERGNANSAMLSMVILSAHILNVAGRVLTDIK